MTGLNLQVGPLRVQRCTSLHSLPVFWAPTWGLTHSSLWVQLCAGEAALWTLPSCGYRFVSLKESVDMRV